MKAITQVPSSKKSTSLVSDQAGNGFVEKIIIIALFAFVVATGITLVAGGANDALTDQATTIQDINTQIAPAP